MHILYFHQHFSTPHGSAGTRSYEMAKSLLRAGHRVTIVCGTYAQGKTGLEEPFRRGRRRGITDSIEVIEFDLNYGNDMGVLRRMGVFAKFAFGSLKLAMQEPADVVFATSTPLTAGVPGIAARWLRGKPFVFEVRDLWPELPRAMGMRNPLLLGVMSALEWGSYRSADRLIALSPGIVEGIARRGIPRERIAMAPNGCDLDLFAKPHRVWRPKGVRDDELLAVFSGTHGPANGLDAVLDAASVLKSLGRTDIRITLIGQGREKSRLMNRARDEGLENVLFLDPVPKAELAGLLAGADIGLQILRNLPAFYFGTSPNKFFDYIAAGLPVLNNYPGWLARLIDENACGFAVPPGDPQAFAEALIAASRNRQELERMGQRARALAESTFSRELIGKDWVTWVTGAGHLRDDALHTGNP